MPIAHFHPISARLWIWQNYDPAVKSDLFSSAVLAQSGLYLIDPIPLSEAYLAPLIQSARVAGIVVTNANHQRSAFDYADRLSVPIFAGSGALSEPKRGIVTELTDASVVGNDLQVIQIDGAVAGEIALYHPADGGTLIVGDALINFEPYGFAFLPRKYCQNEKQMRKSLRQLLTKPATRMLFAHGTPILSHATARLRQLLEQTAG